jgi:geranylgeranyl pyrophosphate synthase
MTVQSFEEYYGENLGAVERALESFLQCDGDRRMGALTEYSLERGKRLRPVLCLLSADIYSTDREKALRNTVLVEFIHSATLIHDDVTDNDAVRRGMLSLWRHLQEMPPEESKLEPRNLAVLLGDGMLSRALGIIDDIDTLKLTSRVIQDIATGALREAYQPRAGRYAPGTYTETIRLKTGSLFGLAAELGSQGTAAGPDECVPREVGIQLGIIYQMADDLSDGDLKMGRREVEDLLLEHCAKFSSKAGRMPKNDYRRMMEEVPLFIVNAMMKEGSRGRRLILAEGVYTWEDVH